MPERWQRGTLVKREPRLLFGEGHGRAVQICVGHVDGGVNLARRGSDHRLRPVLDALHRFGRHCAGLAADLRDKADRCERATRRAGDATECGARARHPQHCGTLER